MDNSLLPIWLDQKDAQELERVTNAFWQKLEQQLFWWLEQQHSEHAQEGILNLLAYERGLERLPNEDLTLFGKRVKHAFANAKDAGFSAGMERIFKRLGFGFVLFNERVPGFDWDMIEVQMLESEFAGRELLVQELLNLYGRTCRRYFLNALSSIDTGLASAVVEFRKEVIG